MDFRSGHGLYRPVVFMACFADSGASDPHQDARRPSNL